MLFKRLHGQPKDSFAVNAKKVLSIYNKRHLVPTSLQISLGYYSGYYQYE